MEPLPAVDVLDDNDCVVDQNADREDQREQRDACLLYTSDAADERSSVDLGGRRIIKKKSTQGAS